MVGSCSGVDEVLLMITRSIGLVSGRILQVQRPRSTPEDVDACAKR